MSQRSSFSTSTTMSQLPDRYSPDPQQAQAGIGSMFSCDRCSTGAGVSTTWTNGPREASRSVAECHCQDPEHSIELTSGEMQGGRRASDDGRDSSSSWELVELEQRSDATKALATPSDVSADTKKNCSKQGGTKDNDQAYRVKSNPSATGSDKHESTESRGELPVSGNKKGIFVPVLCTNPKQSTSVAKNEG